MIEDTVILTLFVTANGFNGSFLHQIFRIGIKDSQDWQNAVMGAIFGHI
jgi:hypothetical protein